MKRNIIHLLLICLSLTAFASVANPTDSNALWKSARPDGHAPLAIMGDHYHNAGEFMISYRYMNMFMSGDLRGDKVIGDKESATKGYMMFNRSMKMDMHMLELMYAPHDNITFMLMTNFLSSYMEMYSDKMGLHSMTTPLGLSDMQLYIMGKILNTHRQSLHINVGLNLPTGSITVNGHPGNLRSPYNMQLGTGTWDMLLSATYLKQNDYFSWGAQGGANIRYANNAEGWRFGNQYNLSTWMAFHLQNYVSASISLKGKHQDAINGKDPNLNLKTNSAYPENYGGLVLSTAFGFNFYIPAKALKNLRFALDCELPFYQNLNGDQMRWLSTVHLGVQYSLSLKKR